MGLFSKEPPEKKAYWKALSSAIGKPNEKNFAALESACGAYAAGWQGWLFMELCYDMAAGVSFDPDKAKGYHAKALRAAEVAGSDFPECFYGTYEDSATNFRIPDEEYFPRTLKVRQAGAAMMLNFDLDEKKIVTDVFMKDDRDFWVGIFSNIDTGGIFKMSDEQVQVMYQKEPFTDYLYNCSDKNASEETRVKNTNKMLDKCHDLNKVKKGDVTLKTVETFYYVVGHALLVGGTPYLFNGRGWHQNSRIDGWNYIWRAANLGYAPALHFLAQVFDDVDFCPEICYACSLLYGDGCSLRSDVLEQMLALLELCAVKGDEEALRLIDALAK